MVSIKDSALIVGVALICVGRVCLPAAGLGTRPFREPSTFVTLADSGAFLSGGGILIIVGLAFVSLALLTPLLTSIVHRLTTRSSERLDAAKDIE